VFSVTDYSSMGPQCGLRLGQNASLTLNNNNNNNNNKFFGMELCASTYAYLMSTQTSLSFYNIFFIFIFRIDTKKHHYDFTIKIPSYSILGVCDLGGRILLLPIQGHGPCNLTSGKHKSVMIVSCKAYSFLWIQARWSQLQTQTHQSPFEYLLFFYFLLGLIIAGIIVVFPIHSSHVVHNCSAMCLRDLILAVIVPAVLIIGSPPVYSKIKTIR